MMPLMVIDIVTAWRQECQEEQRMIFAVMRKGEPMDDLISRQAAIEAVCEDGTMFERQGQYSMTMAERKQRDTDILDALPSAQPFTSEQIQIMQELEAAQLEKAYELGKADRPKWIPLNAKGREPEDNGEYLLQLSDGFITITYYDGKDWELWANSGEPVAWMPLPEPYKESE